MRASPSSSLRVSMRTLSIPSRIAESRPVGALLLDLDELAQDDVDRGGADLPVHLADLLLALVGIALGLALGACANAPLAEPAAPVYRM